ncbi:MAG: tRNA uridine-5-carboxymethylaminomethyl(34) synthesis GTPase MnmE [Chromatiaceae bacterium]|nr:MAG: tRNA uridine-5-carboxymethylaminomethyl(34) synthesis GTPase MnmE [Chromatiaceae bacterium]
MLDTIAAIATAPGIGAIGIVRVSGPAAAQVAIQLCGDLPAPRRAVLRRFRDTRGELIDQGLVIFSPGPASYTGEDVLELQGHGGPVVLDLVLNRVLALGARPARAGEFSERAFLNGRLDLTQAEAVADLIRSHSATQARLAARSLSGVFARRIAAFQSQLTRLRVHLEASLDFPDEDLDPLTTARHASELTELRQSLQALRASAHQGELIRDGLLVVIAGAPNVGKSSLLNALAGQDRAIVTPVPGTTRDLLHADITLDGLPLRLVDTAGLRVSTDPVEQEGIRRAQAQIGTADHLLWLTDDRNPQPPVSDTLVLPAARITLVHNKIDLTGRAAGCWQDDSDTTAIACSVHSGAGLDLLRSHLKAAAGYRGPEHGEFSARRRHLYALDRGIAGLQAAVELAHRRDAPELLAEALRLVQQPLGEITGEVSADDLLGQIFSEFCIGK